MQKKKKITDESSIKEKIEYLGLNFERVPKSLIATDNLNFKALKSYDEKQYKQYRFIKVSDIDILLTPTHRMDELKDRYEQASPLYMYLDSVNEENAEKYTTFLKLLKKVEIAEVDKIEKEQEMLAKQTPFKVKYNGNYLWQIFYSEYTEKYFMLLPTEDSDYSTFFYLLKKKIENKKNDMIFVPISYLDYSEEILKKSELKDIENYLWLFTKDYPSIYEVYDKKEKASLQIIGETTIYGKIKTLYKMIFENKKEANKFLKLLKALFILQISLPKYYEFVTEVNTNGELELFLNGEQIKYDNLLEFVSEQYSKSVDLKNKSYKEIERLNKKLAELKKESTRLEKEYLEKEKIISTYLECKKTFFGKVKYFFTMGKKSKKTYKEKERKEKNDKELNEEHNYKQEKIEQKNYTLDELIMSYKDLEIAENNQKTATQDINAIKLKNKNLKRKLENAISYINEINKHKKSIFEFWKYSNKDEVAALEEGEEEEINVSKIEKVFNYENDYENFAEKVDKNQRIKFTDQELESCYLASTDLIDLMNELIKNKNVDIQIFSDELKKLKDEKDTYLEEGEEFDVFGNINRHTNKEMTLGNKTHRETHRDKYEILEIRKGMKGHELKIALSEAVKEVKKALKKNTLDEEIYVYKATTEKLNLEGLQIFSLNDETEIKECINNSDKNEPIYMYRLKLKRGTNFVALSNIIFYNNRNMTLPVGMQGSSSILLNLTDIELNTIKNRPINIKVLENEKDDFSKLIMKKIEIIEMEN